MTRAITIALSLSLLLVGSARADDAPETFALFIGANIGSTEDEPLRYAEADAEHLRALFVELGGVRAERALLVRGGGPAEVKHALDELAPRLADAAHAGRRTLLLVYYSGHGDEEALHLPHQSLLLAGLRAQLAAIPSALRIVVLDACRSMGREKGAHRSASFSASAAVDAPHGAVELRASSVGESAQESSELGGSVFTHFLLSALRGAADSDHDGRVTLSEVYAYAYRHTLLRTGSQGALQHPALTNDLAGAGELVLSWPQRAVSQLELPGGADRYLVFQLPTAAVLGEVSGEAPQTFALPAGRFLVARRAGGSTSVVEVDLPWGGKRSLATREFRAMSREELVARGGRVELHPFRLELRVGSEISTSSSDRKAASSSIALDWTRGVVEIEAALGYAGGPLTIGAFGGWQHAATGRLAVGLRLFAGRVTLNPSLGLAGRWTFQSIRPQEEARAREAGLSSSLHHDGGALGPELAIRAGIAIAPRLVLSPMVSCGLLLRDEQTATGAALGLHPVFSFLLGVGYAL